MANLEQQVAVQEQPTIRASLCVATGILLMVVCSGWFLFAIFGLNAMGVLDYLGSILGWSVGTGLLKTGRMMLRTNVALEPISDFVGSVFYLRPFYADRSGSITSSIGGFNRIFTEEEKLAVALRMIGQPVTVVDPNEGLSPLGIRRVYHDDQSWQEAVS